jgi:predicted AlkP superfamily pyrophosphatase or phosphodiesterase
MDPVVPAYGGACLTSVVPSLLGDRTESWLPAPVAEARQVVLLVLDGLGWEQLQERRHLAPTLAAMAGGPITSVAPTTTATALTSITTGAPPAEHGVVGYRVHVGDGAVMNVLRWETEAGDARDAVPPEVFQHKSAFNGTHATAVIRAEFLSSGFTRACLRGARLRGWRMPSTLVTDVAELLRAGEAFVYGYYDGIDRVAHQFGMGEYYEAELRATDRLVADIAEVLPPGAALVVTADHGQVDVGQAVVTLDTELAAETVLLSGEGRFRWLHARPGASDDVAAHARELYGDRAWVHTRDEMEAAGWFGGPLAPAAAARLGDVALLPFAPIAFLDPGDVGEVTLVSRHGSLTPAEAYVPLVALSR